MSCTCELLIWFFDWVSNYHEMLIVSMVSIQNDAIFIGHLNTHTAFGGAIYLIGLVGV